MSNMRTMLEVIAYSIAKADPDQGGQNDDSEMGQYFWEKYRDHYMLLAEAALQGAKDELVHRRGDPRCYGQGFADPIGPMIHAIDQILSDKSST